MDNLTNEFSMDKKSKIGHNYIHITRKENISDILLKGFKCSEEIFSYPCDNFNPCPKGIHVFRGNDVDSASSIFKEWNEDFDMSEYVAIMFNYIGDVAITDCYTILKTDRYIPRFFTIYSLN